MMVLTRSELSELLTDNLAMFEAGMDDGIINWASHPMEVMFGYQMAGSLDGMKVEEIMSVRYRQEHACSLRPGYACDPKPRIMGTRKPLWGLRKDGSEFPVGIMLMPKVTSGRRVVVGLVFDITGREELPTSTTPKG